MFFYLSNDHDNAISMILVDVWNDNVRRSSRLSLVLKFSNWTILLSMVQVQHAWMQRFCNYEN